MFPLPTTGAGKLDSWVFDHRRVDGKGQENNEVDKNELNSRIKTLYDDGAPFFTKGTFQDIYQRLKSNLQQGDKVLVRGADGVAVELDIEVGRVLKTDNPDLEYITMKPGINYTSPLVLMQGVYTRDSAYCCMIIYHALTLRNKHTKEPIDAEVVPSIDIVSARFKKHLEAWESSKTCLELQATLDRMEFPANFKIDKIVAFACGRIAQTSEDLQHPLADDVERRISYQHGLIRTLHKALSKLSKCHNIQCFAQDPAYTRVDSELLKSYEITTIDGPEGFLLINDATLVVSMMPNIPVKEIVSHIARPAMIVWDIDDGGKTFCTDPTSPRVKDFLHNSYSQTEFPHDLENFKNVSIYRRLHHG